MRERNKAMGWQDSPFIFATFIGTKAIGEPNVGNWSRKARQLSEHMVDYLNDPLEHFRIHDLRRTVGWFMADEDVRDEVIDTVLGHTQGKIRRTYLTNSLDKQTKVALLTWNDRLDRIVNCGYAKS
jgi:integrase